jgi:hypothetical protein
MDEQLVEETHIMRFDTYYLPGASWEDCVAHYRTEKEVRWSTTLPFVPSYYTHVIRPHSNFLLIFEDEDWEKLGMGMVLFDFGTDSCDTPDPADYSDEAEGEVGDQDRDSEMPDANDLNVEGMETEEGDFNPDDFPDDNPDGEPDPQYEYRARLGLTPPGSVFGGDSPIPPFCPPPDGYSWESVSDKLYGIIRCSQSLFRDEIEEMSEEAAEAGRTEW